MLPPSASITQRAMGLLANYSRRLLMPATTTHDSTCGFKVKTYLKLRCYRCYYIRKDGRLCVECPAHPRHRAREPFDVKLLW
ncbi:Protein MRPL-36 [Aphelenchoides avenae]|nr:Protein MRPL-36 [Aphelenchus avenae]